MTGASPYGGMGDQPTQLGRLTPRSELTAADFPNYTAEEVVRYDFLNMSDEELADFADFQKGIEWRRGQLATYKDLLASGRQQFVRSDATRLSDPEKLLEAEFVTAMMLIELEMVMRSETGPGGAARYSDCEIWGYVKAAAQGRL